MATVENISPEALEIQGTNAPQEKPKQKPAPIKKPIKEEQAPEKKREDSAAKEVDKKVVIKTLNKAVEIFNNGIRFILEKENHGVVVEVFNKDTGKVIRRIPPEDVLQSLENISELAGVLIDKQG
jgi:flagellar protein FlaG